MDAKIPLVAVVGPTASGKTSLGIYLAKHFNGEIVSADSMQIYKEMNIATAKPSNEEKDGIPHHMMDFLDISESFSVSDYVNMANIIIDNINKRNKLPIVVGGTGLYINSLIDNIIFTEAKGDPFYRKQLKETADKQGGQILLDKLNEIDPDYASTLHPNNIKRIIRGLEIYKTTNIPMSTHLKKSREKPSRYKPCFIGLDYRNREKLYERINRRVDIMVEDGLIEEARTIIRNKKTQKTSFQAIGYKELEKYFNGKQSRESSIENIKQQSRRYAKRQLTWFRKDERINWFYLDEVQSIQTIYEQSVKIVENQLDL